MSLKGPILTIDDDEDDQYLLRQVIKDLPVTNDVYAFFNGKEALHYLETTDEQPFLILCDINMPQMDGLELREYIIQNEYLRNKSIPFVYFTTAANPDLIRAAYNTTVQGFYQKAAEYAGLQEQIRLIIAYWQSCLHPNQP
ncbi:response regulator [Spirosoma soli]|uniref:Response regulator n=1 Tax=Spirosoma soli TaxID=1770529 RepID=A0ABW5M0L6_9BACT